MFNTQNKPLAFPLFPSVLAFHVIIAARFVHPNKCIAIVYDPAMLTKSIFVMHLSFKQD